MSVGDVVNLVGSMEGFSQRMLDDYAQRLADNNINGTVLLSCDLGELKHVLQMAFGDWVLFQSMVESLRYSEQSGEPYYGEVSPPMEVFVRRTTAGATMTTSTTTAGVLNTVTSNSATSKKATSDATLTSASNSDVLSASAGASRSSPALKEPPATVVASDRGAPAEAKPPAPTPSPKAPLKRQDSFVDEVLMESETLRGFIQASVVGSDSEGGGTPDSDDDDEDVQRPITTIPEESQVSRNTSESSLGRSSLRQVSIARRTSVESGGGPIDRAFSVGPDQDSGESDSEVERRCVSRRSSVRQIPAARQETAAAVEERRKKSRSKSMKHDSHAPKLADKSKSVTKLDRGGGGGTGSECSVPLMSLYFPMACETTPHGRTPESSPSSTYISPKAGSPAASTGSASRHSETTGPAADSSEYSQGGPQPASSAAAASSDREASMLSQPAESAVTLDNVKFFIVDESDASPKAIMVEMEALPPHRVTSSVTGDPPSSYHDFDHVAV